MSTASAGIAEWLRVTRSTDQIDAATARIESEIATTQDVMLSLQRELAEPSPSQTGRAIETVRRDQMAVLAQLEDLAQARWLTLLVRPLAPVSQLDRVVRHVHARGVVVTAQEVARALPDISIENVRTLLGLAFRRGLLARTERGRYAPLR